MSNFVSINYDLQTAAFFCYHLKKTGAAYSEYALGWPQSIVWFKKFKSGDFNLKNEERWRPP